MKGRALFVAGFVLLMAGATGAQTKISGTLRCDKPEPVYSIEVGDNPGHSKFLEKQICTWAKPMEINGDKAKDGSSVLTVDATSTRAASNGSHVTTMQNGDKTFSMFSGTAIVKDGKPQDDHGTWSFTGGTGKLKGIKGKGTYKTAMNSDGTGTVEVEGEYNLPQPKAPK